MIYSFGVPAILKSIVPTVQSISELNHWILWPQKCIFSHQYHGCMWFGSIHISV